MHPSNLVAIIKTDQKGEVELGCRKLTDVQAAIRGFDRPIIGAINGVAVTGGFELALWCDVLIVSPEAKFADTHARVGVIPGWGLSQRLSRLIGINRERELSFTGNFLSASKAENWGLVNRIVESEALLPICKALAEDMASCDRQTLVRYKQIINEGAGMDLDNALKYERLGTELHSASQTKLAVMKNKDSIMSRSRAKSAV
ncbi:enoyl-CoA hydratase-related protein [Colwellia sp. 20A7]|uniref:enoyl-CoA hydratase-related protein n=1 Tax=Colwellia sp. 20A7 TaxID=2689569 RepID=UPI001357621A|nr:enoyl-CoA hydratase-related protein [Colwellia sp. 20A7]